MSAKAKAKLTPEQRKATLTRVLHKIRPYSLFVVCSLIVAAVSVAAQLYIPILCGDAIDLMLGKGNVDFAGVGRIIVEVLVVAVVAAFAQWLLSVCNNRITFSVSRDLRNEALRKIQTLPLSYLDSHPSGDIVSRMVADVDTFADGLLMGFTQLFSGVLTILGTLLFMLSENVVITLVVVCITPLSLLVASFLAKRSYKYFQGQSSVRGEQTALVNEMIEGQKVVQAFGHEAESLTAFDEVNGRLQDVSLKAIFFSSLTNPATRFVNNIVYAGVGLVGAVYAVRGGITIGQLSVFLSYANQYTKPFNEISGVVTELLFGSESGDMAALTRCADCLDSEDLTAALAAVPEDGRTFAARRQQAVEALLDAKRVLAIVRKQDTPFLTALCARQDAFVVDLDDPASALGCVVMASGLGRRFGGNKLMADFCGAPLIANALALAALPLLTCRIVVTRSEEVEALCNAQGVPVLRHAQPYRSDTVRLGLAALLGKEPALRGCLFLPGDQPLLTQQSVEALALAAAPDAIVRLCAADGTPGSPVLFGADYFSELLHLPDGRGGNAVARAHPGSVCLVSARNDAELRDVDTREDLNQLRQLTNR